MCDSFNHYFDPPSWQRQFTVHPGVWSESQRFSGQHVSRCIKIRAGVGDGPHLLGDLRRRWGSQNVKNLHTIIVLIGGWPTPLKNHGVRQLGWWHSQCMESHKIPWFQNTNRIVSEWFDKKKGPYNGYINQEHALDRISESPNVPPLERWWNLQTWPWKIHRNKLRFIAGNIIYTCHVWLPEDNPFWFCILHVKHVANEG